MFGVADGGLFSSGPDELNPTLNRLVSRMASVRVRFSSLFKSCDIEQIKTTVTHHIIIMIIIIMEICKATTLRFKVLNKHSITRIMYIEMEILSAIKMYIRKKKKKANT